MKIIKTFEIEYDSELGDHWFCLGNLDLCLHSKQFCKGGLIERIEEVNHREINLDVQRIEYKGEIEIKDDERKKVVVDDVKNKERLEVDCTIVQKKIMHNAVCTLSKRHFPILDKSIGHLLAIICEEWEQRELIEENKIIENRNKKEKE